ncbi:MAG: hypothetical protein U9R34_05165, partial [Nanoarchaeota archaeon]|nr:hypothetical protein [Nanoarchaeota archaeon]
MVTMNMMKTIKKRMLPVVLAGSLLIGAIGSNPAIAQDQKPEPKVNMALTRVQKDSVQKEESKGINCAEILVKNLPFNSDIYTVFEDYGNSYYAKFRLQSLPVKFKNSYFGLAAQHKNSTSFDSYNQFGLVGRLQGAPTENTFGKIDLRYFPRKN